MDKPKLIIKKEKKTLSSQDAVTQGKELIRYGYEGLYVSGYREV